MRFVFPLLPFIPAVWSRSHVNDQYVNEDYDVASGILKGVTDHLDDVINIPKTAISIMETYHKNQGFRPHGLHAQGRDRVLTYLYSLYQAFDYLKLYFGTEAGEYFTYFPTEMLYREPGNSGYSPDDPVMKKYWDICVNGGDGAQQNCSMSEGANYIKCVDDCELVKCPDEDSQRDCDLLVDEEDNNSQKAECKSKVKWCPSYTIEQAQGIMGFVPLGYHCIDEVGMFSQTPGKVLNSHFEGRNLDYFFLGNCTHWDGSLVTGLTQHSGPFAYCGGEESCDGTYTGLQRTTDYDPRQRPWYIGTKEKQTENWSQPYPFASEYVELGITYAEPFYITAEDGKTVFEGVFAVDYTVHDISKFLIDNYGEQDEIFVLVFEAAEPHGLIGISSELDFYKDVLTSDPTVICTDEDQDCITVRVAATDLRNANTVNEGFQIASRAVQAQAALGFPSGETVTVKETDELHSAAYFSKSVKYTQDDLEWIVLVTFPMDQAESDTVQSGDILFTVLIIVATAGVLGCSSLLVLWYKNRDRRAVKYGDFKFTSAFLLGCILLNLSSFTSLGENTDPMCMLRFWSLNMCFSLAIAPLFAKVYRIYVLVGTNNLRRREFKVGRALLLSLPIIALQFLILLIFSFLDPPYAMEEVEFDTGEPIQHIQCGHDTDAFLYTQSIYVSFLVVVGCILSFLSRNMNSEFGEAKQLFFGMYNAAFTGICFICLIAFSSLTPAGIHTFRTIGIFWGTVTTCSVFVLPRLFVARRRASTRISISGLDSAQLTTDQQRFAALRSSDTNSEVVSSSQKSSNTHDKEQFPSHETQDDSNGAGAHETQDDNNGREAHEPARTD